MSTTERPTGLRSVLGSRSDSLSALIVVLASGVLILALSLPAFRAFFLGEDFTYLGQLRAGRGFGVQPTGYSVISINCSNAMPGTTVMFQGRALITAFGDSPWLTAIVPSDLYAQAGTYEIYLLGDGRESNHLAFVVRP